MASNYVSGHHPTVLKSHIWRTAENSAAYLLPYLKPDMELVDIGCGPGTITLDLATLLPQGHVWGIDTSEAVISQARALAKERSIKNVTFVVGNVFELADLLNNRKVDVVHAHQVLQHIPDQKTAMLAMRAALKQGGILAARDTDFSAMAWYPPDPALEDWRSKWQQISRANGCDPDTGRKGVSLALAAGFKRDQIVATAGTWCYSTLEERQYWGGMWAERVMTGDFASRVLDGKFGTQETLVNWSDAWKRWVAAEDGWFALLHGEIICRMI